MGYCPEEDHEEEDEEQQQVRSRSKWPVVLGLVVFLIALLAVSGVFAWKTGLFSALNPFSQSSKPTEVSIEPSPSSGNKLPPASYPWSFDGHSWTLTMEIPEDLYLYYTRMERAPVEDYSIYVTHPKDDQDVNRWPRS